MKTESSMTQDLFKQMLAGDSSEWAMLTPFDQDQARKAQSIVQAAFNEYGLAEELVGRAWLVRACYDAHQADWDLRGWSAQPRKSYPFDRVERGERPFPHLLTIPSTTSTNTLVVMVAYQEVNFRGYGDLGTAQFYSLGLHPSADAAEQAMRELTQAIRFLLNDVPRLTGRGERAESRGSGRWDDAPDF